MSASADLDLLDPPSLAHSLTAAARSRQRLDHAGSRSSSHSDSEAHPESAATRTALEAAEKTVALLRAQLVTDSGDADDAPPPPAKRRAVEREGGAVAAAAGASALSSLLVRLAAAAPTGAAGGCAGSLSGVGAGRGRRWLRLPRAMELGLALPLAGPPLQCCRPVFAFALLGAEPACERLQLLAPRFYVECALLRCCDFGDEALDAVAARLARSARGFGDASRGAFARSYLAKCVLAAGADRGVLAALRDDVAGGDGPAVAWILEASGGGAPV